MSQFHLVLVMSENSSGFSGVMDQGNGEMVTLGTISLHGMQNSVQCIGYSALI